MECSKEFDDYREMLRTEMKKTIYKNLIELAVSKKLSVLNMDLLVMDFNAVG